ASFLRSDLARRSLALPGAPVFLGDRPALLVAGDSALSRPNQRITLGDDSLLAARGSRQHRSVGLPCVLGPAALSPLWERASPVGHLGTARSSRGWSPHVGAGFPGLSHSGRRHWESTLIWRSYGTDTSTAPHPVAAVGQSAAFG